MSTWKYKLAAAAIAVSAVTGVALAATPAVAAPAIGKVPYWQYKSFYYFWSCTDFLYGPPAGVTVDIWYGCKLTAPGTWTVKYHKA